MPKAQTTADVVHHHLLFPRDDDVPGPLPEGSGRDLANVGRWCLVDHNDCSGLPYLGNVIKQTIRWSVVGPLGELHLDVQYSNLDYMFV